MQRRVLHIIYSLFRGGAERLIETLVSASDRKRYDYLVCSLTGGDDLVEAIEREGARVFLLGKKHRADMTVLPKLIGIIRREKADLLHLHNSPGTLWGTLAAVLGGIRIPIVNTEHRPFVPEYLPRLYRFIYPFLSRRSSSIICVSASVRASFIENFPALTTPFVTILNGIRTEPFDNLPPKADCRAVFKLPAEAPLLGTVGRLAPVKNHLGLIEAFYLVRTKVPGAHLAILGEGKLEETLKARAADLGIADSVSFIAATPSVERFLGALDAFVLSSKSEGLPLSLLEALAAGLPVVSNRVGGVPEVIEHGRNGYMVSGASPASMADRITDLLLSPETAAEMGRKGRETVRRRFHVDRMVAEIEGLYDGILGMSG